MTSQERAAHSYLEQGRFREAREEFKSLCKQDRTRFLPYLIEANLGLARSMIRQGQTKDAGQVLAYLKTIAPAGTSAIQKLEAELAMEMEVRQAPNAMVHLLETLAKTPTEAASRVQQADRLVLLFPAALDAESAKLALAAEVLSVVSGLKMVSEKAFVEALDATRVIGHHSPFSHWRLFIKALVAFHQGDREKAARFFSGLPPDSVPGRASEPFHLLLGRSPAKGQPIPTAAVLEAAGKMLGESGMGRAIWMAEQACQRGDASQVYLDLQSSLAKFPAFGTSLCATLTDYAVHSYRHLDEEKSNDFGDKVIARAAQRDSARKSLESMILLRMSLQAEYKVISDSDVEFYFEAFLGAWEAQNGRDPSFAAAGYAWLGNVMLWPKGTTLTDDPVWDASELARNPVMARRFLEKAIELDPSHLQAHLTLCEVFLDQNLLLEEQQLLETMVTEFPGEKKVLLRASEACLERNSLGKAIRYLEMARKLDRIDPTIPDRLAGAFLRQAREHYLKKRADLGRKSLAKAEELGLDEPLNVVRSKWCLAVHRGVLESVLGNGPDRKNDLVQAEKLSPSEAVFLYYAYWVANELGKPGKKQKDDIERRFKRLLADSGNAKDAILLTRIWSHIEIADCLTDSGNLFRLLQGYLRSISLRPMGREEATVLVEYALTNVGFAEVERAITKEQLKKDPQDPYFRYADLRARKQLDETFSGITLADLEELKAEAIRRKDSPLVQELQKAMDSLGNHPPQPRRAFSDGPSDETFPIDPDDKDPFDDDHELFSAAELDELRSKAEEIFQTLPPEGRVYYKKMITILKGLSEREFEAFQRTRPAEFPKELFDVLVILARGRIPKKF